MVQEWLEHYRQSFSDRVIGDLFSGADITGDVIYMKAKADVISQMQSEIENELYDIEEDTEE